MMRSGIQLLILTLVVLLWNGTTRAQSVETYVGHQRAGIDLMWYKFFQNRSGQPGPILFFSRTRASTTYEKAPTAFGTTNAISYNFPNGVGIVGVGSFVNNGFVPKAGVQLVRSKGDFLFFGWLVADLVEKGNLDLFGLLRYQPHLTANWRLFAQLELFPVYQPSSGNWSLTQRIRLGAKWHQWAAGWMTDLNQSGNQEWTTSHLVGGFLRYDF
ncbi:MAG TPA: hypothetical protein P5563_06605 [Saprospiraceae bacterium]|nr:hypothetical protein [Saprospiraceae bacterium]